jgi:phosphoglycolate phosphatase
MIVASMRAAAAELGLAVPEPAAVREIVGLGLSQALAQLFPELEAGRQQELAAAYSRHYAAPERARTPLFPGAMTTLEALRDRGFELAVATGKSRRGLDRVLASLQLADFFEATRCADETRSKPHPLMLREIMAERGKSTAEVVMVGDSEYDLAMAREAGVSSVGVSYGVHPSARLASHQPLAIIDELPQLLELSVLRS